MNSVRTRLTIWFSLAVTAATVGTVWSGHLFFSKQMRAGIDFLLDAEIQEIIHRLDRLPDPLDESTIVTVIDEHARLDAPIYYFQIHDAALRLIYRSPNLRENLLPDLTGQPHEVTNFRIDDLHLRVMERIHRGLHIQVATSLDQVDILSSRLLHTLIIGTPILLLISVGIGHLLVAIAFRPVSAMHAAAARISASNLSERLPIPPGDDDIAQLARLLNRLFDRLEAAFEQIKRFTADASHEIRTPLSLLRLQAERLANSPNLDTAEREAVAEQLEEIARLNRLVESLLLLARADSGNLPLARRRQPTHHFIADIAEDAATLAEESGHRFALGANEPASAEFDATLLRQVIFNGLANALRHIPKNGTVTLSSHCRDGTWQILLEDTGPGVPENEIQRIFDRFVRGPDGPAGLAGQGNGLGLAIAASIVRAHNGAIRAENRQPHGLRLVITLPGAHAMPRPATAS
ncbi:MAG: HAMP domain-containing protein [Verrucomicrobia bacterium]|nr:MAG: HAMP domain-containing protein [Verrucomicrobiota bacterium]